MQFKICFERLNNTKMIYHITENNSYEIILKEYFKGIEKKQLSWLIEKFGALYTDEQTFNKYYTVYQQGDLFNDIKD